MSILPAMGGAALAFAVQASGDTPEVRVDPESSFDACVGAAPDDETEMDRDAWKALIACVFQQTAMQIDAQLPIKLDDSSTLVAVSSVGPQFNYTYVVNTLVGEIAAGAPAAIEKSTRASVCEDPDMLATIQRGGSYFYRWLDRSGAVIHTTLIEGC